MDTETLSNFINRRKRTVRRSPQLEKQLKINVEHIFFGKGCQVEVSSDEEGFKGSWYTATVIQEKRKMMEQERYLVEYATLVEEKGSKKPLREYVYKDVMRPPPPPTEVQHEYELNDVVDAWYRDGWWMGVVVEVLDERSRFRVFFENPTEKVEFAGSDLRVHHDWVDNKWVRAEKKAHPLPDDCTPEKAAISSKGLEGQSLKGSGTKNPQHHCGKSSVKSMKNKKKLVNNQHSHNVKRIIEPDCGVSSQARKRGRPKKHRTESPIGLVNDTQEACIEKASTESEDQQQKRMRKSKDRPHLMWREGMNSPNNVDDSKTSFDLNVVQSADAGDGEDESSMRSPATATCDSNVSEKDKKLPFEKRSPVWAILEHMEIFQTMPQNPHFGPLVKSKEDIREGLAIAKMVIFSSAVEKTSRLQFSDPRSIIDSRLETLSDLETHGFDVHPIRRRLKELLSKKENQGHLLEESKALEMKIEEQTVEKVKLREEICEITKKMEEITKKMEALQEKLLLAASMEKMTSYEIDMHISKMNVIDEDIQNAQRDFERLAAAPW